VRRAASTIHLVIDDLGRRLFEPGRIADSRAEVRELDRDLVTTSTSSRAGGQLVTSVVKLCTELGASVVAEGIETHGLRAVVTRPVRARDNLFARPAFPTPNVTWPPPAPR